jgi:hypothetical protein
VAVVAAVMAAGTLGRTAAGTMRALTSAVITYHGIGGGCARRANGADLATLGDDLCFPCRGANGCIDSWDACPVVGTGEVTASSNTAKQRLADISPNCASKAKSMTPSGKIAPTVRSALVCWGGGRQPRRIETKE